MPDTRGSTGQQAAQSLLVLPRLSETDPQKLLALVLSKACDVVDIDGQLRAGQAKPDAALFDAIRKRISQRREFAHYMLDLDAWSAQQKKPALLAQLRALGFGLKGFDSPA